MRGNNTAQLPGQVVMTYLSFITFQPIPASDAHLKYHLKWPFAKTLGLLEGQLWLYKKQLSSLRAHTPASCRSVKILKGKTFLQEKSLVGDSQMTVVPWRSP